MNKVNAQNMFLGASCCRVRLNSPWGSGLVNFDYFGLDIFGPKTYMKRF